MKNLDSILKTTDIIFYSFFPKLEQKISQFIWTYRRPQISKGVLRKKNGVRGISLPDFRLYYKATVINTV